MSRVWEKFTAGPTISTRDRMHITINQRGIILLNRKAYEAFGSPKAVVLFFEKPTSVIGLSPAQPKLREAFPVKHKDGFWTIHAIPFCREFGIQLERTEAFTDPEINDKGVLELDLRTTRAIFGGIRINRKKKPRARGAA